MTSSKGNIFRATGPCAWNSPVTDEFPSQRPAARSFVIFQLRLNKTVEQTIKTPVIRDAIALIVTPFVIDDLGAMYVTRN